MFVCLFVCKGALLPQRVWAESSLWGPSFPLLEQGRHSPLPVAKTERHTYIALGSCTQGEWQWSTTHPRPEPDLLINSYSNARASSMDGICEKAIMSPEFHFSVFWMGWLCSMSNRACWKHGHSLSRWSKVSGSSSQNLHSSETDVFWVYFTL